MRILIEPGSYRCQNMGDVAMLKVAVRRLSGLLPEARLDVFTGDPEALARQCPGAEPLPTQGRAEWLAKRPWLPGRSGSEGLRRLALHAALRLRRRDVAPMDRFLEAVEDAVLVVVCGQGSMGDTTREHASTVLALLEMAHARGIPTAMMGQGIGPLSEPSLRRRAASVLPEVGVLGLREGKAGRGLVRTLGVPDQRVWVTGDDAIELAYGVAPPRLGGALGLTVRVSPNAGTGSELLDVLTPVLQTFQKTRGAPLVPLPIARGQARDATVLRELLQRCGQPSDGGESLDTPEQVITGAGQCRLLVTGAYHAAVFALAQGIPAVCLAENEYYRLKFEGLADQFGTGVHIVRLDAPGLAKRLQEVIAEAWENAAGPRAPLLAAAAAQVDAGWVAYRRLPRLVRQGPTGGNRRRETSHLNAQGVTSSEPLQ